MRQPNTQERERERGGGGGEREGEMEKEERRKKIISRGTDRLALITGRISTLDPDPISKCSSFTVTRHNDLPTPQHARSSSEPLAPTQDALFQFHNRGNDAPDTLTKPDYIEEVCKGNDSDKVERKETATSSSSDNACSSLLGSSPISATEINFSILSTENIRAICSVAFGVLIVVSHVILPYCVLNPESLITYGPLYILMLTDVLIVALRLAPHARMRQREKEIRIDEDELNFIGAVKYLELGLVLHQTIRALFIDCSLYLAVVVIGLSLL